MVVKPRDWTDYDSGGYLNLKSSVMRTHGCMVQLDCLKTTSTMSDMSDQLSMVYRGLNCLQKIPWKIDKEGLNACKQAWDEGLPIGDLPSRTDVVVPQRPKKDFDKPKKEDGSDYERTDPIMVEYFERLNKHFNAVHHVEKKKQRNAEMHSMRADTAIKLKIAEEFKDYDKIYFPYNLDFRGRVYPVRRRASEP